MLYEITVLILFLLKLLKVIDITWFIVFSPIIVHIVFFILNMILSKIQLNWLGMKR